MRRIMDFAFYIGIVLLAAAVAQSFGSRFQWSFVSARWDWLWWVFVIGGVLLTAVSFLPGLRPDGRPVNRRSVQYGLNTVVVALLVLGIVGFVEAFSYHNVKRLDLTENRRFSLSPQTIQMLKQLPVKVSAVAFYRSEQPGKRLIEDLFKQYSRVAGDKFVWKVVDPDQEPALARGFGIENYGTTVLEAKGRSEKVLDADQEEKLTNALLKVTREGKRVVYVVQGHGEADLGSTERAGFAEAKTALEKSNYEAKELALARQGKVPEDAAVLIIAGPRSDFFGPEIDALDGYLGRGGKLLAMINPSFPEKNQSENLRKLLGKYGLTLDDDVVIELNPIGQVFGIGPQIPIVQRYEAHPITRDMAGFTTLFPLTRSISMAKTPPQGVTVQPLARTTPDSWGETDRASLEAGQVKQDAQDPKGPLTLAAVATKDKARLVVYGTANVAINQFLNVQNNRDFFLNTVSWLAEQEDQISIRPKDTNATPIFMTSQQGRAVLWIPVVILPALALLGGIVVVSRRRAAK